MELPGVVPPLLIRTKSKHTRPTNASKESRTEDQITPTSLSTSSSTPRFSERPAIAARTSSAPLLSVNEDLSSDAYSHRNSYGRESIASIKDDLFFRNYQSPQSMSLAKELRSATYTEHMRKDKTISDEPPPRSEMRPSVASMDNSVNLPVCWPNLTSFVASLTKPCYL